MEILSIILSVLSLIIAAGGFILSFVIWKNNKKIERAKKIVELINLVRDDSVSRILYLIEYDHDWYDSDFHDSNDKLEFQVDRLFSAYSYICYLSEKHIIDIDEFEFFKYGIQSVFNNESSIKYLTFLKNYSRDSNKQYPFKYLYEYGKKNNFL